MRKGSMIVLTGMTDLSRLESETFYAIAGLLTEPVIDRTWPRALGRGGGIESQDPHPLSRKTRKKGGAPWLGARLRHRGQPKAAVPTSVVLAVVVAVAAIAVGIVGLAISALVAFAVFVLVAALV